LSRVPDKEDQENLAETAYRQHYGQVYRFLRRKTRSDHEAEELTQRVFTDAVAALSSENPPQSLLAWLFAVAERRFVDEVRRRASATAYVARQSTEAHLWVDPFYGAGVAGALRRAVGALPPAQRSVVVMKVFEERPFQEIASTLGTTEAACKMRFSRAIRQVRDQLREEGVEP
jgi:RNA polymerase sigma-70 factor (ECF subfamily)